MDSRFSINPAIVIKFQYVFTTLSFGGIFFLLLGKFISNVKAVCYEYLNRKKKKKEREIEMVSRRFG